MWRKLVMRSGYALALFLLGTQSFIILLDFTINTLFFDELGSWLVTLVLAWIIKKQRDLYNTTEKET